LALMQFDVEVTAADGSVGRFIVFAKDEAAVKDQIPKWGRALALQSRLDWLEVDVYDRTPDRHCILCLNAPFTADITGFKMADIGLARQARG
jgi:hypothetical protein